MKTYNTKEFLASTDIPHAASLTYYIDLGIIQPEKVKGRNQFSQDDVEKVTAFRSRNHDKQPKIAAAPLRSLTSTYTTQELMEVTGIKFQSVVTRMVKKGVLKPTRLNGRLHFSKADVERYADYKEAPYKDQTVSKFEKLVLRVEQLEQEVLQLKEKRK